MHEDIDTARFQLTSELHEGLIGFLIESGEKAENHINLIAGTHPCLVIDIPRAMKLKIDKGSQPYPDELIEIRDEYRKETASLKKRIIRIPRLIKNTSIKLQPGILPVYIWCLDCIDLFLCHTLTPQLKS